MKTLNLTNQTDIQTAVKTILNDLSKFKKFDRVDLALEIPKEMPTLLSDAMDLLIARTKHPEEKVYRPTASLRKFPLFLDYLLSKLSLQKAGKKVTNIEVEVRPSGKSTLLYSGNLIYNRIEKTLAFSGAEIKKEKKTKLNQA